MHLLRLPLLQLLRLLPHNHQPRALLAHQRLLSQPPVPHQARCQAFHAQATTHSLRLRAWAFLAQFHARATTHSHLRRAWVVRVRVVRLVPVVQVAQVAQVAPVVPVAQVAPVVPVVQVAPQAQVLPVNVRASAAALQPAVPVALPVVLVHLVRAVAQAQAVAAVSAAEPQVHSVRVALVVRLRPVSQSARNAKSTNKELRRA